MAKKQLVSHSALEYTAKKNKKYTEDKVKALDDSLNSVAKSGAASDVTLNSIDGLNATQVQAAIAELLTKQAGGDITVDQSTTADGMVSTTVIKKNGVAIGTINIPKDYVNNIVGIVNEDGDGKKGVFLKVNVAAKGDEAQYQYVDASGLVEYVESGSAAGDMFFVNISADHKVTVTATDGTITKAKLTADVQTSLGKADTALQSDALNGYATEQSVADGYVAKETGKGLSHVDVTTTDTDKWNAALQSDDIEDISEATIDSWFAAASE